MLLTELRRRDPGAEAEAHRRAATWYETRGLPEEAVAHALAARDTPLSAELVARYGQRVFNGGRIQTVRGWLFRLAGGATPEHPSLAAIAGWIWALTGDVAHAQLCLQAAERGCATAGGGAPVLRAAVLRLRAGLAPDGVQRMLRDAREAEALEAPGGDWYPMAAMLLGSALLFNDGPDAAIGALERAAHFAGDRQRAGASVALAQLGLLFAGRGDWVAAEACVADALARVEAGGLEDYLPAVVTHVAQARLALHHGDPGTARRWLGKALRLYVDPSPRAFPWLAAQMALELGGILLELDDVTAARRKAADARQHLAVLTDAGTLARRYAALTRDLGQHRDRSTPSSAMTMTAAEMRVLRMLPTHLTLSEIADALFLSRNTVKSQVASIYAKLLVTKRGDAVRAARELNLLD
jgi:LuxR family maltose regulon positive regulatory protein